MKILIVADYLCPPSRSGNTACTMSYIQMLKDLGHEVHYLYFHKYWDGEPNWNCAIEFWGGRLHVCRQSYFDRIKGVIADRFIFPVSRKFWPIWLRPILGRRSVSSLCDRERFDAIIVNYWYMIGCIDGGVFGGRKVAYTHDLFADRFFRTNMRWLSTSSLIESRELNKSDCVIAIQENEGEYLRARLSAPVVTGFTYFAQQVSSCISRKNILFLASGNPINVRAIEAFVRNAWPIIAARDRDARLVIGGGVCGKIQDNTSFISECISVVGEVDDLSEFYSMGGVAINPIETGTGLKIKTFEALSYGKMVVCHPHSAEGIYCADSAPVILASTYAEWADSLIRLLQDGAYYESFASNVHTYMQDFNRHVVEQFCCSLGAPDKQTTRLATEPNQP